MNVLERTIQLDEITERRLLIIQDETGQSPRDFMRSAVEEAALGYFRHSSDDPARGA